MLRPFLRLANWALVLSCLLPAVVIVHSPFDESAGWAFTDKLRSLAFAAVGGVLAAVLVRWALNKSTPAIERLARRQAELIDQTPSHRLDPAIVLAAGLSLFLELVLIRWQGSVWELFALYKNLSLLACFAGLGLGYALSRASVVPLVTTVPLLAWQVGWLLFLRHGLDEPQRVCLSRIPVQEESAMGLLEAQSLGEFVSVYGFLSLVFLLTALALLPVGQLCGRLMDRQGTLRAYGSNLLGSLLGVLLTFVVSWLWTPPEVWFVLALGGLLCFQAGDLQALKPAAAAALLVLLLLALPVNPGWERIYSPYQLLERGPGENGLTTIRAAGTYYQRLHDLSAARVRAGTDPTARSTAAYYEMPSRLHGAPGRVLVVGAGTGNDVAAALRMGATHVDAVEIDPAIAHLGKQYHPERPYSDPRVTLIVNDARTFLRSTPQRYDLIVFGLLDSHALLSQNSNVRLDSFVYTVEAMREARACLRPGGTLSLAFSMRSLELARKFSDMIAQAFDDGRPPACVSARYDEGLLFLKSAGRDLELPPGVLKEHGFRDLTAEVAGVTAQVDPSTDDWPFLYMPRRVYPLSYLCMMTLVLLLSLLLVRNFLPQKPQAGDAPFFLLGAGFMLVETKGITELGLVFGNTWQVIGLVIAGILVFAFLGNAVVATGRVRGTFLAYVLLLASLAGGLAASALGGFGSGLLGRLATTIQLTCPLFFSGILFSVLLSRAPNLGRAMAANLFGALCGGLLEYNSMYFGFRFLYLLALAIYGLAFVLSWRAATPAPARAARVEEVMVG
jgi:SAM-dependent methyltransferase